MGASDADTADAVACEEAVSDGKDGADDDGGGGDDDDDDDDDVNMDEVRDDRRAVAREDSDPSQRILEISSMGRTRLPSAMRAMNRMVAVCASSA